MNSDENKIRKIVKGPSMGYTDNLSKREMWEKIAKELQGEFKVKRTSGGEIEMHHITIPFKKWTIQISVSDSRPLKFQGSFLSSQDFNFTMSRNDFLERIISRFSNTRVELGWKDFDRHFLVTSKRSDLVKRTFTSDVQKALLKHNVYSLLYQTHKDGGTAEFISVIQRSAGNREMITELVEMFKLFIDNLEKSRIIK